MPGIKVAARLLILLILLGAGSALGSSNIARKGMVASADSLATAAGLEILQAGGNAADAAIATALALGVCEPFSSGLGGGCFIVTRHAESGTVETISGREVAPAGALASDYLDQSGTVIAGRSEVGASAVAVPGALQALSSLHQMQGDLPWAAVVEPARRLAAEGFVIRQKLGRVLAASDSLLRIYSASRCQTWWRSSSSVLGVGDTLRQPELAHSLARIAVLGSARWITDYFAPALESLMIAEQGALRAADLRAYRPRQRATVQGNYKDWQLHTMGAPSSGGALLVEMLNVMQELDVDTFAVRDPRRIDLIARTMEYAFADRARWFGDDRFSNIPLDLLLSESYRDSLLSDIRAGRRVDQSRPDLPAQISEGDHTSHLCVVDAQGNAVSLTATINTWFGSCLTEPLTGVVLNNEMDDFVLKPGVPNYFGLTGSDRNAVRPGAHPLSSMCPVIITKDGELFAVLGSEGGSKIISTVLNLCLELMDYNLDPESALKLPRFHQQWRPTTLRLEKALPEPTTEALSQLGWELDLRSPWSTAQIIVRQRDGSLIGAADPRADGRAAGF